MFTVRLRYEKTGVARFISHLDLMRTWQRAFRRTGLPLSYSEGFNPHPYLSIAQPLPVGVDSVCELLDFGLSTPVTFGTLPQRINQALPCGLSVLEARSAARKFRDIAWAVYRIRLRWDVSKEDGAVDTAVVATQTLTKLLDGRPLPVLKRSKKGATEVDAAPLIQGFTIKSTLADSVEIEATLAAGDISLSPALLLEALLSAADSPSGAAFAPWCGVSILRLTLLDGSNTPFS